MPKIQSGEIQLSYREVGAGLEPLVLSYGFQSFLRVWDDVIDHLTLRQTARLRF